MLPGGKKTLWWRSNDVNDMLLYFSYYSVPLSKGEKLDANHEIYLLIHRSALVCHLEITSIGPWDSGPFCKERETEDSDFQRRCVAGIL